MHLNVSKDENIPLLLRRLSLVERIKNTFDIKEVSQAIQMLDWQTSSTDYNLPQPTGGDKFESFAWVKSAQRSDIPHDCYFMQQLSELKI